MIDQAVIEVRKALDESGNIIKEQGELAAEHVLLKSLTPLAQQVLGSWLGQLPEVDDRLILESRRHVVVGSLVCVALVRSKVCLSSNFRSIMS